jgi:hypothetical protein
MVAASSADPAVAAAEEAAAAATITCPAIVKPLNAGKLKANGVRRNNSRYGWPWSAKATIGETTFFTVFEEVVEAACAADLAQLVVHGPGVPQQLNFPRDLYQQHQLAAWADVIHEKEPSLELAVWDGVAVAELAATAAAERAALNAAADAAQQPHPYTAQVRHVERISMYTSVKRWRWKYVYQGKQLSWCFNSFREAACAADLARLALHGPLIGGFNLPVATYTQQQVAAWQQLLQRWQVSKPAAADDYAVEYAGDAAIAAAEESAAAAAPAEAALFSGQQPPPHGSWVTQQRGKWMMSVPDSILPSRKFVKYLQSGVQAACAADLARLALQGSSTATAAGLNFPASIYTQQQMAAMHELLQLEQPGFFEQAAPRRSSSMRTVTQEAAFHLNTVTAAARDASAAAAVAAEKDAPRLAAAYRDSTTSKERQRPYCWQNADGWTVQVQLAGMKYTFPMGVHDVVAAACAADLARLAIQRKNRSYRAQFNFASHIYTQQQVAAFEALLAARYPDERPSMAAGSSSSSSGVAGSSSSSTGSSSEVACSSSSSESAGSSAAHSGNCRGASSGVADSSSAGARAMGDSLSEVQQQQQQQQVMRSPSVVPAATVLLSSGTALHSCEPLLAGYRSWPAVTPVCAAVAVATAAAAAAANHRRSAGMQRHLQHVVHRAELLVQQQQQRRLLKQVAAVCSSSSSSLRVGFVRAARLAGPLSRLPAAKGKCVISARCCHALPV